ncbi:DUF1648 domain-containing protein [Nesterenkonia sp. LB17]|uniref:DUF1648 domain-containing protein n=1 Tax=Nesterenkonia sp. LB17 TaxID=2901230 RepID=UPI001F4CC0B8|nr:DUF1648 domain-containing protein [Nesterenkonia sp. LB17]MCH8564240.1 DUF1648 domain-containing protein [Nesterenkonia sp. LB17]
MIQARGATLIPGRLALIVGLLVYTGVLAWIALDGPDPLPAHLGFDGTPTRWASKTWVLSAAAVTGAVVFAVVLGCRVLISRVSPELLSLPSTSAEAYWTTPERRPELNRRMSSDLELIFGATYLLLAWITAGLVRAADGSGDPTLTVAILVYAAVLVGVTLMMFRSRRYRAPEGWADD